MIIRLGRTTEAAFYNAAATMGITPKEAKEQLTFVAYGESGLRVLDALLCAYDMTAQALAEETGKKLSAIRTACGRLMKQGLLEATRAGRWSPKVYAWLMYIWARLEALAPHLRTYKLSAEREDGRLVAAVQWTQVELRTAGPEEKPKWERRIAKLSAQRIPQLATCMMTCRSRKSTIWPMM